MKSVITAFLTCVILFGISMGTTKYLYQPETETEDSESQTASEPVSDGEESGKSVTAMPVAFRPDNAVSVEAVLQMSDSIKKMEQQLIQREQRLAKEEQRVKLLFDDLATHLGMGCGRRRSDPA